LAKGAPVATEGSNPSVLFGEFFSGIDEMRPFKPVASGSRPDSHDAIDAPPECGPCKAKSSVNPLAVFVRPNNPFDFSRLSDLDHNVFWQPQQTAKKSRFCLMSFCGSTYDFTGVSVNAHVITIGRESASSDRAGVSSAGGFRARSE
jgi:hypothetical protein